MPPKTGQPFPTNTRLHRALKVGTLDTPSWAPGAAFVALTPISIDVPIAGDNYTRLYFKCDDAGELTFAFLRPDRQTLTPYDTPAADAVAVVADTEVVADIAVQGEAVLRITFTPVGAGVIEYADVCHIGQGL